MTIEDSLSNASCSQPFSYLGPHLEGDGYTIRVWMPGAISVEMRQANIRKKLTLTDDRGLFQGQHNRFDSSKPYNLCVVTEDSKYTIRDPYQYREQAYHSVHFIDHKPTNLYTQAGAQQIEINEGRKKTKASRFAVYAPNATAVSLIGDFNDWDGRRHPMQRTDIGYWVLVSPEIKPGDRYKYQIKDGAGHLLPHKADPLGFAAESFPSHASLVFDHSQYQWNDEQWMKGRGEDKYAKPMSIYEVHLGSWKKPQDSQKKYSNYRELAHDLVDYINSMGYTHIELLPVSEFPFDGSWGYQPVGMFAPTCRFGSPDDFKYFVDYCHQNRIGVIIDWVPAHFPEDGHGLARFDGSFVYEYEDPRRGWHPDWNSCIYDFGKDSVRQFLVASALFWLDYFHVDGIRVDAVASMLYLDYSRKEGEWIPNVDGGNENYEAISLLKWMNEEVYSNFPSAMTIAEESTSFAKVSRPVYEGGLGFGFKWNMGWMHDSLHYISKDPAYRFYHHNDISFSMVYAYDENFILPLSHDEVVHGKGSLLGKMPGDEWQQAANHRSYAGFMYAHPGKKLNFMGNEIGQSSEWNHDGELDWSLLDYPKHKGIQSLYRTLNALYTENPALHDGDHKPEGFSWIDHQNSEQSVLSFVRQSLGGKQKICVISNFTPVPHPRFRIGVPEAGEYRLLLNTDDIVYWGSGYHLEQIVQSTNTPMHNMPHSIEIALPPLATTYWLLTD